jgi:3-oxoacyl-[acyl-carrier-protein] synthase II
MVEGSLPDPRQLLDGDGYNADAYLAICRARPELLVQRDIPSIATLMSAILGLRGPSLTVQSACTSATQAVGEAFQMIRSGKADLMVAGGTDSMMSVICVSGFTLLGALSPRQDNPGMASRPFDAKRDGFVLGEGAGLVILEEMEHAASRNAPVYAEVIGYGSSSDGYRFTDIHPEGDGPLRCMQGALDDAGIEAEQIDYINAHGTSTPQNDRVETLAVKKLFGKHAYRLAISSTKSQLGHLICAAGGIECIFTALTLQTGILPPTINLEHSDPECDLDYVAKTPRRASPRVAISNSFGFGGQNGTLVLRRMDQEV